MQTRTRRPQERPLPEAVSERTGRIEERSPLHDRADALLRATDDVLSRIPVGRAREFLEHGRQESGQ
jgi:hypothetical protein